MATEHTAAPAHSVEQPPVQRELWWVQPLLTVIVLSGFAIYSFWSIAIASTGWEVGPYLSPFFSPLIHPGFWPLSPALLIFWMPLGFRATCYYYRKAYYRSFFLDPPACAISDPGVLARGGYGGEQAFPWRLLNFHRFFLYLALVVLFFLWVDTIRAFIFDGRFGIGLGSLVFLANVVLLSGYTFSCHSLRHLVGGGLDCFSCSRARRSVWEQLSALNPFHGALAWASLFSVVAADLYVRLLAAGAIADPRIL
jgi:hypothetical protein